MGLYKSFEEESFLPKGKLTLMVKKLSACPVCGSKSVKTHVDATENSTLSQCSVGSSRTSISHGRILRCRNCGFGFNATRLADEELAKIYSHLDDKVYEAEAKGRLRTALLHSKIVHRFVRFGRLLDVGCASGGFLQICAGTGLDVVGVEPAEGLSAKAKKTLEGRAEIYCTVLQQAPLAAASFDAVTLWDVLEHVEDPAEFLRLCASLLKPGGHLFANVPDLDSLQARVLGRRWPLFLPEHLNYFSRRSLEECGKRAGLELERFGRRPAFFSLDYVFYRLAQHQIFGASIVRRFVRTMGAGSFLIPVYLGETYGVWTRQPVRR